LFIVIYFEQQCAYAGMTKKSLPKLKFDSTVGWAERSDAQHPDESQPLGIAFGSAQPTNMPSRQTGI
jgi:hypothetical protein